MNKILFIFAVLFVSVLNAYEQGHIDMHGKDEQKLLKKKIDFSIKSIDYLLHSNKSNTKDTNSSKIKYIKIDDIQNIKSF